MIKRTLYFGNPAYLSKTNEQLVVRLPGIDKNETLTDTFKKEATSTIPIEDIGVVVLDHQQITITQALLSALLQKNVAIVNCDSTHHPDGMFMALNGNTVQSEKFRSQIDASVPLKKNLWAQTIAQKIYNQAMVLKAHTIQCDNMIYWSEQVRSGDPDNYEARAAAYYWKNLSPHLIKGSDEFKRERFGVPPNNLLNYGYSIIRAIVARSLVGSGLLPTLGLHHHNRYNAFCLADDIMEPYRPYVDLIVCQIVKATADITELTGDIKKQLLAVATVDVKINNERSPLMIATQRSSASLVKCFEGETRKVVYPELI